MFFLQSFSSGLTLGAQEWGGDKPDSDDDKNADAIAQLDPAVETESLPEVWKGVSLEVHTMNMKYHEM